MSVPHVSGTMHALFELRVGIRDRYMAYELRVYIRFVTRRAHQERDTNIGPHGHPLVYVLAMHVYRKPIVETYVLAINDAFRLLFQYAKS